MRVLLADDHGIVRRGLRSLLESEPGLTVAAEAADLGIVSQIEVRSVRGYLVQGDIKPEQARQLAADLLADSVVEAFRVAPIGDPALSSEPAAALDAATALPAA